MAVVVVGGHSRNIGKTSVVCGIVRALPDRHHGVCSRRRTVRLQ